MNVTASESPIIEPDPQSIDRRARVANVEVRAESRDVDGAQLIARQAEEDQHAAAAARVRYRSEGIAALVLDPALAAHLDSDESAFAIRREATVERREHVAGRPSTRGLPGTLLLTSRRLLLVGEPTVSIDLAEVQETVLGGSRLLVVLRHGAGIALDVDQPQLLRVEIAAARAVARGDGHTRSR